jgi:hypothetical protein
MIVFYFIKKPINNSCFSGFLATSMSATSRDAFGPWMKKILDPTFQARLNYGISPLFLGLTSGPMYGGVTGIMMNMAGTPELQLRILRHTALFCNLIVFDIINSAFSHYGVKLRSSGYSKSH